MVVNSDGLVGLRPMVFGNGEITLLLRGEGGCLLYIYIQMLCYY